MCINFAEKDSIYLLSSHLDLPYDFLSSEDVKEIFQFLDYFFAFQMPEEQAFCLFMKILKDYGHRNLFKDNFEQLHQRFYIIERLMEVIFLILSYLVNIKLQKNSLSIILT